MSVTVLESYRQELLKALRTLPLDALEEALSLLRAARDTGHQVFIIGNGGSAATAAHMVSDLSKSTIQRDMPRLRVVTLIDNMPLITAWANDTGYENVFAQQMRNLARSGDVLIALSGSGNSENILRAVRLARELGMTTIGMTGAAGGHLKEMVDLCISVQSSVPGQIEDVHHAIGHMLAHALAQPEGPV